MTHILDLQPLWDQAPHALSAPMPLAAPLAGSAPMHNLVSVILAAHRCPDLFLQSLQAVLLQPYVREVIIVDIHHQAGRQESLAKLVRSQAKCFLVHAQKHKGLAAAFNLGARHASGQYFLLLQEQTVLSPHALFTFLQTGLHKPLPWLVGCAKPSVADKPVTLLGGGFHAKAIAPECLLIPQQVFMSLKGLDSRCFHSAFHWDLCLRMHLMGGSVYAPTEQQLIVSLPVQHTLREKWQALGAKLYFLAKHYPRPDKFVRKLFECF